MRTLALSLALAAWLPCAAGAAWWAENDYVTGSNGEKRDSATAFARIDKNFMAGASAAFYRNTAGYREKVYAFRAPLMYSGARHFLSLTPFVYPVTPGTRSGAKGARAYLQTSMTEPDDENYLNLTVAGALASQDAMRADLGRRKSFSESSVELQAEKSFFGQFYLLGSAAAFGKSGGATNGNLAAPALDHSEMAYLGTFTQLTALPDWVMTFQASRSMKPDFDSHLYLGYSRISLRQAPRLASTVLGMKLELNAKTTLDLAYNAVKAENAAYKNYYRVLLRLVF